MTHLGGSAAWTMVTQSNLSQPAVKQRMEGGDTECAAILAKQQPIRSYLDMKEHLLLDDWWVVRDAENLAGDITVPTLLMMGWQDEWNLNAGTHMFKQIAAKQKKLIVQNGGHGVGAPELRGYWMDHAEAIRWLDHYLKGENNGIDREPMVSVYWEVTNAPATDGSHAVVGWKTNYPSWPAPNLRWDKFYLTADGGLNKEPPAPSADNDERAYLYPSGTELVGDNTQFAVPPFPQGTLSYRTPPMTSDITLLGLPQLKFFVSSEQNDTDFMITLKDVDKEGNTLFLQRAFLRASLRAVDMAKSTPDEVIQSFKAHEPLVPGQITPITLSIPAIGHVLRQGHRLELSILAPSPIPAPVMGGLPLALPSINKVYHAPAYPSSLLLPVVPGEVAQKAPPPCGSLQFQPCRPAPAAQ
jgi:putative CocE/NonD family hydrolase